MSNAALLQHPELAAPTQDRVIPCLGVGCKQHGNCLCYQEVEFSDPSRMLKESRTVRNGAAVIAGFRDTDIDADLLPLERRPEHRGVKAAFPYYRCVRCHALFKRRAS